MGGHALHINGFSGYQVRPDNIILTNPHLCYDDRESNSK